MIKEKKKKKETDDKDKTGRIACKRNELTQRRIRFERKMVVQNKKERVNS